MTLHAIQYSRGKLEILNQRLLPHYSYWLTVADHKEGWAAIREMKVRGAPAIAIVGALSLAVELASKLERKEHSNGNSSVKEECQAICDALDYLVSSRPTAVNLSDAAKKLRKIVQTEAARDNATVESLFLAYIEAAEEMLKDDLICNKKIGEFGKDWIRNAPGGGRASKVTVLTHCNTGSLATAGYGTALGIVRSLHYSSSLLHVYCTETRPYNQGSRLTAYELKTEGMPGTLITDSMAAALLALRRDSEHIAAVVVGADRIVANGDTANKIGTLNLAVLARHFGVRFVVAATRTTIDMGTTSGAGIKIEERDGREVTTFTGPRMGGYAEQEEKEGELVETIWTGDRDVDVWNPSFDVTPAELIDAIVTEKGVAEKGPDGKFNLAALFDEDDATNGTANGA